MKSSSSVQHDDSMDKPKAVMPMPSPGDINNGPDLVRALALEAARELDTTAAALKWPSSMPDDPEGLFPPSAVKEYPAVAAAIDR